MKKTIKDITHHKNLGHFLTNLNKKLKKSDLFHGKINFAEHKTSKTEFIGTLVHSGFDLLTEKDDEDHLHFTLKKIAPHGPLDEVKKAKKPIFKQERVGRHGNKLTIWKLRTMFPMAHKAQKYLYSKESLGPYGKVKNDFRITPRGKFLRRYWIDELLQIVNIIKGEMKLVGLRPLTRDFFDTLPPTLQQERVKHLPALMAAIYADQPKGIKQRIQSELKYLSEHSKRPLMTDIKYFFKILNAIIFRGQRGY